ncbi:type VI secretion system protein TssA [Pseudomonas plecoglossicida]|uniref:type VI secretion system protein TssA n=1 Tax=Pseudomonas plecoglossicida TaxID=70775 RepID=UPI00200A9FC1|nr:type VI secretion system protein TssA [Pseudomonas plecoglossicida]
MLNELHQGGCMLLDDEVGRVAIAGPSAAGVDAREGAAYLLAQAEVEKLNNINAREAVDWVKVSTSCVSVLREEGKDLGAAVWLLCAWYSLHGVTGLRSGVRVLRDLLQHYWAELTPPEARVRARRGQIEWMLDWLDRALSKGSDPVMPECIEGLLADWDALEEIWSERDAQSPGFFRLRRCLASLPVEQECLVVASPAAEPSSALSGDEQMPLQCNEPISAPAPAPELVRVHPENMDAKGVVRAIEEGLHSLGALIPLGLQGDYPPAMLFRINRQVAWVTLEAEPPAQQSITRIPPPPNSQVKAFAAIRSAGSALAIVQFCESRLLTYPYWLELNRVCHAALLELGPDGGSAAASVVLEVRHLMARLPGLAELKFASGVPFADGATLSWLEAISPAPVQAERGDAIGAMIDEAGAEAVMGRLDSALQSLHVHLGGLSTGRDRFRLRRAQCELLHRFDPKPQLRLVLDVIIQEALERGVDRWEPELLRPLLELTLQYREGGFRALGSEQLVAMDLPAFWRLTHGGIASQG